MAIRSSSWNRGPKPKLRSFEEARGDIGNRIGEQKLRGEREKYLGSSARTSDDHVAQRRAGEGVQHGACQTAGGKQPAGLVPGRDCEMNQGKPIEIPESRSKRDSDENWFALWTRSRHEQVVRDQLEQKRIETFLPTVTRWSRWKDRKKKIDWPLFPGLLFCAIRSARSAACSEMHRRREHHFI